MEPTLGMMRRDGLRQQTTGRANINEEDDATMVWCQPAPLVTYYLHSSEEAVWI